MKYQYVLFDLDGTISRSAEGIRASLEHAIRRLNATMPDLGDYTRYIGPPLIDTFKNLVGLDDVQAELGAELYRSYYNKRGKFLNHRSVHPYRTQKVDVLQADHAMVGIDGRMMNTPVGAFTVSVEQEVINFLIPC